MRYWTCHWQWKYWCPEVNKPFYRLRAAGSNLLLKRGVRRGDRIYVVSLHKGLLYLGGRLTVDAVVPRLEASQRLRSRSLYEDAREWAVGFPKYGTPLHLTRSLAPGVTARIRFKTHVGLKPPFLRYGLLDVQATRGVREVDGTTAVLFEQIIAETDVDRGEVHVNDSPRLNALVWKSPP